MIVIIGYGLTTKGAPVHLYIGDDMDAAIAAAEKAGLAGSIERAFIIKDAAAVWRHVYGPEDAAARASAKASAEAAARQAKLTADQLAAEQAAADQKKREQEAAALEAKAAALRKAKPAPASKSAPAKPVPAAKIVKIVADPKASAEKPAAPNDVDDEETHFDR